MALAPTAFRLRIDTDGKLRGAAQITHNIAWPCVNGNSAGMDVPAGVMGVVMHTMVGDLPGTISVFNRADYQASAHFGIAQDGSIHQFGPVNGWMAWAQEAGNPQWYSIEHADAGDPSNPLTEAQLTASAQVLEALSQIGKFPLRKTNHVNREGYGVHFMGGAAWGGHTCPQPASGIGPRAGQRNEVISRAKTLRDHGQYPAAPPPVAPKTWTADGQTSLVAASGMFDIPVSTILRLTVTADGAFSPEVSHYLQAGDLTKPVPIGSQIIVG